MRILPKPYPATVDVNPANATAHPVGEAAPAEPQHEAVHAVSRARQRTLLLEEAARLRLLGRPAHAAELEAEAGLLR
jgi:hypothetical protein